MKKRSDKILALLLCAFMAFSFIAAAVEPAAAAETETAEVPPVETAATTETTELTEDPGETPADADAPAETPTETEAPAETPAAEETPAATETPAVTQAPAETPAATETPAETEAPAETQAPAEEPKEPETTVELKTAEFNGDAAGMNFTVSGDLPVGGKLQVTAIDPSCNDYIVDTYLNGLELPEGTQTAFDLTILTKDGDVFEPAAGNEITVTVSSNDGTDLAEMAVYHLPQVTAAQIVGAVNASDAAAAEAEPAAVMSAPARARAMAAPAAVATQAETDEIRHYEVMSVDHYDGNGKRFFQFTTKGFSVYYIVSGKRVSENGDNGMEVKNGDIIYAMPGTTIEFKSSITPNGNNYNRSSFSINDRFVTVSSNATAKEQISLYYGHVSLIDGWNTKFTIIVMPEAELIENARNKEVLVAVKRDTSSGIPNEPGNTVGYYTHIFIKGSSYVADDNDHNFASSGSGIISPSIANDINFVSSVDGSSTYGVYDASGVKTLAVIQAGSIDWDEVLNALAARGGIKAADGTTLTDANKDQYKVVPYVVKYKSESFRWHIDCAVVRKDMVTLTYFVNFDGSQYVAEKLILPNAVTKEKNTSATVGYITKDGRNLNVNDKITVTDVAAANGQTAEITFRGWNTKADGTGTWYYPEGSIQLPEDTSLYAIWDFQTVTGDLKISKTVNTKDDKSEAAPADDGFTFTVSFGDEGYTKIHDYIVYNSDGTQASTGKISRGGTLSLKAGQYAVIEKLPNGVYTVTETLTEEQAPYYTADSAVKTGEIKGGEPAAEANYTNTYAKYKLITKADDHGIVDPDCPESNPQYYGYDETEKITVKVGVKDDDKAHYDIAKIIVDGVELTGEEFDKIVEADGGTIEVDKKTNHTVEVETVKVVGKLTITKSALTNDGFIFHVVGTDGKAEGQAFTVSVQGSGSVTLTDIPIGTYRVTEDTSWSWRYSCTIDKSEVEVSGTEDATVTITNTVANNTLLDGSAYAQNNSATYGSK